MRCGSSNRLQPPRQHDRGEFLPARQLPPVLQVEPAEPPALLLLLQVFYYRRSLRQPLHGYRALTVQGQALVLSPPRPRQDQGQALVLVLVQGRCRMLLLLAAVGL